MEDVDDINVDITSFIDYVTELWLEEQTDSFETTSKTKDLRLIAY